MPKKANYMPAGYHTATPYLVIRNAAQAVEFYKRAFGATELFRMTRPDGTITHGEIQIGDTRFMFTEEGAMPSYKSPQNLNGSPVSIYLYVEDADHIFRQAVAAGATQIMPVEDMFWGDRYGRLTDPYGHEWHVATHQEDVAPAEMERRAAAATAASHA